MSEETLIVHLRLILQEETELLAALCALNCFSFPAFDYVPLKLQWLKWAIGYQYRGDSIYPLRQYFIGNMIDGDQKTAWVVGGRYDLVDRGYYSEQVANPMGDFVPAIYIDLPKKMKIDGIRIMPGYNKSQEVFMRDNRITKIALHDGSWNFWEPSVGKPFAIGTFDDSIGWKTVSFKPQELDRLQIEIKEWTKGTDNDFCISEIELLSDGKPVSWERTPMMVYTDGDECG